MNIKKLITITIIAIFAVGMIMGAASAGSHKVKAGKYTVKLTNKEYKKLNKYKTVYKQKYKTIKVTENIPVFSINVNGLDDNQVNDYIQYYKNQGVTLVNNGDKLTQYEKVVTTKEIPAGKKAVKVRVKGTVTKKTGKYQKYTYYEPIYKNKVIYKHKTVKIRIYEADYGGDDYYSYTDYSKYDKYIKSSKWKYVKQVSKSKGSFNYIDVYFKSTKKVKTTKKVKVGSKKITEKAPIKITITNYPVNVCKNTQTFSGKKVLAEVWSSYGPINSYFTKII